MATKSVDSKNQAIRSAREAVRLVEDKLNKLHSDFEVEKSDREQLLKSLEYELSHCRNGTQREPLHNKIEETKKETASIFKIWQKDIYDTGLELVDKRSDLRGLLNDVFKAEFLKFKNSIERTALMRAYAFHRQTTCGVGWKEFVADLLPLPESGEVDSFAEEIDEAVA